MNLTLSPDLKYPNNSYSQFYTVLERELVLNGRHQIALTEFFYPVDFRVNIGSIIIDFPNYFINSAYSAEELDKEKKFIEKEIKPIIISIIESLEKLHEEILKIWVSQSKQEGSENQQTNRVLVNDIVINLESSLNSYLSIIRRSTLLFRDVFDFDKIFDLFEGFLLQQTDYHETFNYSNQNDRNFLTKIYLSLANLFDLFSTIKNNIFVRKTFNIIIADGLSKNEFIKVFLDLLGYSCKLENKNSIVFKQPFNFIAISGDLDNYVTILNNKLVFNKTYPVRTIKSFKIYTDIISDVISNGENEPLLRIVNVRGRFRDYIEKIFDRPHFETINKTRINKIFIKITDHNKNPIDFKSGPIVLKLEIRKSR